MFLKKKKPKGPFKHQGIGDIMLSLIPLSYATV